MSAFRFEPFRVVRPALVLGALVLGAGACTPYTDDIGEPSTRTPGAPTGGPGQTSDGGTPATDGGVGNFPGIVFLKMLPTGASYAAETRQQVSSGFIGDTASGLASSGYVVTAVAPGPDGYAMVGLKDFGAGTVFSTDTRTAALTEEQLQTAASQLASSGYIVTAVAAESTGYTLLGVKEKGTSWTLGARVRKVSTVSEARTAATELGGQGYAVTALARESNGYVLVGMQEVGSSQKYSTDSRLVEYAELQAAAASLGSGGYLITGMSSEGTQTLVLGIKEVGDASPHATTVSRTAPSGLTTAVANLASQGRMVTAMTFDGTNYTLVGMD